MDDVAGGVGVRLDSGQQQSGTGTGGPGACVQGVGGRPELMQDDGIHPNAQAQARLADNVWPHLKPLLKP